MTTRPAHWHTIETIGAHVDPGPVTAIMDQRAVAYGHERASAVTWVDYPLLDRVGGTASTTQVHRYWTTHVIDTLEAKL